MVAGWFSDVLLGSVFFLLVILVRFVAANSFRGCGLKLASGSALVIFSTKKKACHLTDSFKKTGVFCGLPSSLSHFHVALSWFFLCSLVLCC